MAFSDILNSAKSIVLDLRWNNYVTIGVSLLLFIILLKISIGKTKRECDQHGHSTSKKIAKIIGNIVASLFVTAIVGFVVHMLLENYIENKNSYKEEYAESVASSDSLPPPKKDYRPDPEPKPIDLSTAFGENTLSRKDKYLNKLYTDTSDGLLPMSEFDS
uniref:Uncharacterized protein n=1 Tax=viral metagenome TaxID=1070528 RepID=A0A6C0CM99_9ZZZZ